ncbi:hypothetical protein [Pseudobacteriovorax antillogorgiicola]|uniref:Cytochrome c domain-containing protein n=1 Tax=Pseudobacteriovorax antillogorgiicola TaxID=1513793 RepID=A0A1Y6C8P9_9BACT|nr:hypothetical protein [Pseudobacteriovorax antillogorgiicola]TCS49103.1 hypothetical protein EDD56_116146 [Pseudobacteriovorax antillogorgiicola]SMF51703.1 hypothetical protein SAMN06296036_1168 [Pseudobacteriovorax antillogorgiicola]
MFIRILIGLSLWGGQLMALPIGPSIVCQQFEDSPLCPSQVSCTFCHTTPPQMNDFGTCIKNQLGDGTFDTELALALDTTQELDCDNDGFKNLQEIMAGTFPGDRLSLPEIEPPPPCSTSDCTIDSLRAWTKIHQDVCGRSPAYEDRQRFQKGNAQQKLNAVRDTLIVCLDSEYWLGKEGIVWSLAHDRIRPNSSLKSGDNRGSIPLGDYDDDYNLFVYYQTDDRDIRGMITAKHYVTREDQPTTRYTAVPDQPLHPNAAGLVIQTAEALNVNVQQFVPAAKRAGMLTTLYNSVARTMFTPLPRTTAAHAMRHYLGLDIAKAEGLGRMYPKQQDYQLTDFDSKGVKAPACEFCHRALDGIAYLWTPYNGISTLISPEHAHTRVILPGTYNNFRMELFGEEFADSAPLLGTTPRDGYAFGEKVDDLVAWAESMANTDDYARKVVLDYWRYFYGGDPLETDQSEFKRLWNNLKTKHNYSVERMLHEMVTLPSFSRR